MAQTLQQQLKKILSDPKKVRQLKMNDGKTVEDYLKSQSKLLLDILEDEIEKVYSRTEGWYTRSNDFRNSLDKSLKMDPSTNTIAIKFLPHLAWHSSWVTKTYNSSYRKEAYVPQAVRTGYKVFNTGHFVDGIDYLQNAVDRFNKVKGKGITVKIEDNVGNDWWE